MAYKILIVDDSKLARMSVAKLLKELRPGWLQLEAGSAEEALVVLAADRPDVILLDFNMPGRDSIQRINQLWLVTFINQAGEEVVVQAKLTSGDYAPLIAADAARLESILRAASGLAKANNVKMRVIKFTNRLDIEEIAP